MTPAAPQPLALWCPQCRAPHVDEGEWAVRPHKTHQRQHCGHEWRPFSHPTVGVAQIDPPQPPSAKALAGFVDVCQKPRWRGKCCCSCRHHLRDHSHPSTDGGRVTQPRGWVCAPPEWSGVHSGWSEHGLCEMWDPRQEAGT